MNCTLATYLSTDKKHTYGHTRQNKDNNSASAPKPSFGVLHHHVSLMLPCLRPCTHNQLPPCGTPSRNHSDRVANKVDLREKERVASAAVAGLLWPPMRAAGQLLHFWQKLQRYEQVERQVCCTEKARTPFLPFSDVTDVLRGKC